MKGREHVGYMKHFEFELRKLKPELIARIKSDAHKIELLAIHKRKEARRG